MSHSCFLPVDQGRAAHHALPTTVVQCIAKKLPLFKESNVASSLFPAENDPSTIFSSNSKAR